MTCLSLHARSAKPEPQYYPALKVQLTAQDDALPGFIEQEFEVFLKCGRLKHGFLQVRCDSCHAEHLFVFNWSPLRIHAPTALGSLHVTRSA
ncbi:MAG: transposase zinc-binding domain-containing protein [Candidatus Thiodiazotropha sp. (ex Lucina aurantia)]|nr:transposase zinc-binding domain-containing protein [Candidatus Thiodiazotropha sp. (ex Codakia orbicularis)]MBV2103919.1 transposase zinc-binding domain-containing protein [Candidatus Thiodiazotropha sp. (ex Lucina aurantia)]MBV2118358.1 transposase zinc-binding domain-containing protein [Candidatus Thiodiazotropha sp. (ex Lucina aurantia)]